MIDELGRNDKEAYEKTTVAASHQTIHRIIFKSNGPMSSYGSPSLHAQHASLAAAQAGSPAHSLSLSALAAPSPTAQFLGLHHGSSSQSLHGQQQLHHHLQPGSTRAGSLGAGGVGAPSTTLGTGTGANSTTSSDAPNEARKLIRILLDQGGDAQGRLSLVRIQREVEGLLLDVCVGFLIPSSPQSCFCLQCSV